MKTLLLFLFVLLSLNVSAQIDTTEYHVIVPDNGAPHMEKGLMAVKYDGDYILYADATTDWEWGLITDESEVFMADNVEDGLQLTTYVGKIAMVNRYVNVESNKLDYIRIRAQHGYVYSTNDFDQAVNVLRNEIKRKAVKVHRASNNVRF